MNDAGRIGFVMRGEYDSASEYDFLDVVFFNDSSYVAKKITIGNEPTDSNEYWQILTRNSTNKLGNSTVGSEKNPIYLDAGILKASSTTVGSLTKPVYISNGSFVPCSHTLGKSVPSNAMFATGCATSSNDGLMSSRDKVEHDYNFKYGQKTFTIFNGVLSNNTVTVPKPNDINGYCKFSNMIDSDFYLTRLRVSGAFRPNGYSIPFTKEIILTNKESGSSDSPYGGKNVKAYAFRPTERVYPSYWNSECTSGEGQYLADGRIEVEVFLYGYNFIKLTAYGNDVVLYMCEILTSDNL